MKLHIIDIPKLILQRRASAVLGLIIIAMLWAGVAALFRNDMQERYKDVERRNQNYAILFEENILRSIGEIDKALLYLRRTVEAADDGIDYLALVRSSDLLSEILVQVAIIDAKGISRGSNAGPVPKKPIDISDREHFKVHANSNDDKLFISKPVIGRASRKWSVQFTRRLSNPDGSFGGIVVASLDPAHFTSFFDRIDLGATTSVAMIGNDGVVRSSGGGDAVKLALGQDLSDSGLFRQIQKKTDTTFLESDMRADDTLVVTAKDVRGHPLWVTVSTREADIYKDAWSGLAQNALIVACLTVLALIALEMILRAEARAAQKARQLALTLEHIGQGIMLVTKDRQVPIINERCAELLMLPRALINNPLRVDEIAHYKTWNGSTQLWDEAGAAAADDQQARGTSSKTSIRDFKRPDGAFIEVRKTPLPDGSFVQTFTDITTRREAEAYIARLASEDPLTSLPNRRVFLAKLRELCDSPEERQFAVLFMDMDRFKVVNDTIGHRTGDHLLIQVAQRLRVMLRESDVLSRLGGDEFAVLLPAVASRAFVEDVAKRITAAMAQTFSVEQHVISASLSIGIALGPVDGKSADDLLVAADLALYAVKVASRGTYRFYERSMNDDVNLRREVELELREALKHDSLQLHYQPIIDLQSQSVAGFEALARWPHATKGMISPAQFIPIAEECGLIEQLGEWVLLQACRTALEWPANAKISVNVSPIQLKNSDLVATIRRVLATTGLDPHRLVLEFTETIFIEDSERTLSTLHKLKDIGVQIALDDFGTGYSSLSYLRSFPFDTVKIDRSFVSDLGSGTSSNVIVQAIILIAGGLGIRTVAEGVETDEQLRFLRLLGCKQVQGYLLGMPAPSTESIATMEQWRPQEAAVA